MIDVNRNWNDIYKKKATPWDLGQPEDVLVKLVVNKTVKPGKLLELGCGYGNDAIFLAKIGFEVTAIDISKIAIDEAKKRAKVAKAKVKFLVADATNLKNVKGKFQIIYDRACFHFIPEEKRELYLRNVNRLLVAGGHFILIASSDKDTVTGPYRFSKNQIRKIFDTSFEIIKIKLVTLKQHKEKPRPYFCLMKKK